MHQTISFYGSCGASAQLTLVSQRISRPYWVRSLRVHFPPCVSKACLVRFFISPDDSAPTTAQPTGLNVLASVGQVNYLVGNETEVAFTHDAHAPQSPTWLKVHIENDESITMLIDAQITIELYAAKGGKPTNGQ